MSLVAAFDDIGPDRIRRNPGGPDRPASKNYTFFRASSDAPNEPSAFLAQYDPDDRSCAHYHAVDQFQILVAGKGTMGHHQVEPYYVHFARAHTPYGPLHADKEKGWTFMTLRTQFDGGAQRLPGALEKLKQIADRKPWQVTCTAGFPAQNSDVNLLEIPEIKDDQGLFVKTLAMKPGAHYSAPDPSAGAGQFVVVVKGSMMHGGKDNKALSVVFVKPEEKAFAIQAGPEGLEGLILNFPRVAPRIADDKAPGTVAGLKKWQCVLCAFAYDEALGMPDEGVPAGTRWADVPDTWTCPDCGAGKNDFEMIEV